MLDNRGFADVILSYQFGFSEGWALLFFALGFSLFELFLSIRIAFNIRRVSNGLFLIALHAGYTLLAITSLARGLEIDNCGCFGVFLARPLAISTVFEDLFLLVLSLIYWTLSKKAHKN